MSNPFFHSKAMNLKDHCLIPINKDVVIDHFIQSLTQYVLLYIASRLRHILGIECMVDRNYVLLDDRPFI